MPRRRRGERATTRGDDPGATALDDAPWAPTRLLIRPAAPRDRASLAAIRERAAGSFVHERPGDDEQFPHRLDIPQGEDYFCLVAERDAEVIGYVSAGGGRDPDRKSYAEVYEIAVAEVARRSGVGGRLLSEALTLVCDASYGGVTAWVFEADEGVTALFRAGGLTPDGARLSAGEGRGPAVRYAFVP